MVIAVAIGSTIPVSFAETNQKSALKRQLSVYLPDYRVGADTQPRLFETSQLILFAAKPREDGTVDFDRIHSRLLEFGKKARSTNPDLKVTLCVGGWGRGKLFANAVSTEENRNRFVKDLATFCETHQLDGVDIDWEFPKGDREHADFALFLSALSEKLHASGRILTIALGYSRPLPSECWPHIDFVNLMSYQPWSAGTSDYETWLTEAIQRFIDTGLPPEKLLLGVGFFAKEKAGERRAISWKTLVEPGSLGLPASEHAYWPVGIDSCDLRLRLMEKFGLGGVMVWDYGHDSPHEDRSLLRHLSTRLNPPASD